MRALIMILSRMSVVFGLGLLIGSCSNKPSDLYCQSDGNCPANFSCNPSTGLCICASDSTCQADEYCAPDGRCQRRQSCDNNLDCAQGSFCDTSTGNCIESGKCTKDIQCPFGQLCSEVYFHCVTGCRKNGDCPLYQVCRAGSCLEGLCEDKTYCNYGQKCNPDTQKCEDDTSGRFCDQCSSSTIYDPFNCGAGPNFCLIKAGDLSLQPYCGVDCNQGQSCPNGYDCFSVRIVYSNENCTKDSQCSSGKCSIREGDAKGFCLCTLDSDCPKDYCDDTIMECRITRRPCTPGGTECNPQIPCISGFCHIGRNCKPLEGLRCDDLKK